MAFQVGKAVKTARGTAFGIAWLQINEAAASLISRSRNLLHCGSMRLTFRELCTWR